MVRAFAVALAVLAAACGDAGADPAAVVASPTTDPAPVATTRASAPTTTDTAPTSSSSSSTTTTTTTTPPAGDHGCADVIDVGVRHAGDGTYAFDVTVRSADTGPEKYADAWEVRGPDGAVLVTRVLTHPHVNEQPFTRSLSGVVVPPGIAEVTIAARDSVVGFCGAAFTVALPA